jgi:hypothetical protein
LRDHQTVAIRGEEEFWNVFAGELTKLIGTEALFVLPFAQDHRNDSFH